MSVNASRLKRLETRCDVLRASQRQSLLTLTEEELDRAEAELAAWRDRQRAAIEAQDIEIGFEWNALPTVRSAYAKWQRWSKTR